MDDTVVQNSAANVYFLIVSEMTLDSMRMMAVWMVVLMAVALAVLFVVDCLDHLLATEQKMRKDLTVTIHHLQKHENCALP